MPAKLQDTIEREITVRASKERVFKAISDPTQIVNWFPDAVEGPMGKGDRPVFDFGEYGKSSIYVEAVDPFDYFAYRWVPLNADGSMGFLGDVLTGPNTLVEFRLEDAATGTLVKLKESGFSALPPEVVEKALSNNSGGWEYMMDRLEKLMVQE